MIFDLKTKTSKMVRDARLETRRLVLYGSSTRDNDGRFYVVGQEPKGKAKGHVLLQIQMQN